MGAFFVAVAVASAAALLEPVPPEPIAPAETPDPPPARERKLHTAVANIDGLSAEAFAAALDLRSAGLEVRKYGRAPPPEPYVYLEIRAGQRAGSFDVDLIVSDGRLYRRTVETPPGRDPERVVAASVAQLIVAIEDGTVEPDEAGVEIPKPEPKAEPPGPKPRPSPKPVPVQPKREPIELGVSGGIGFLVGAGPPDDVDRFGAWGGGPAFAVRLPHGALVVADLRVAGRGHSTDLSLLRIRIAAGGGYLVRVGPFEMPATLVFTAEPWLVTADDGEGETVEPVGFEQEGKQTLLGGALRLQPGYRIAPKRTPNLALRVGVLAELAISTVISESPGPARVSIETPTVSGPAFRLGGFEVGAGLEVTAWFRLARRSRSSR